MGKALIIVESPTKIKTLKKFLGDAYLYESSLGHIRDLPAKGFGIDVENDFEPQYETLPEKAEVIRRLIAAAKKCDIVYLSPDPDREGEAIAWHLSQLLPKNVEIKRAAFNSITKSEVVAALEHPAAINYALVDAQQARRLLDRMVGYKISPLLARRLQGGRRRDGGISAGRVQSVALKLVVDREKEIEAFKPVEYWNVDALFQKASNGNDFRASLHSVDGQRVEKEAMEGKPYFLIPNQQTAQTLKERIDKGKFQVTRVEKKEKLRHPTAPFITSTLQQEASRHFRFSSARTMKIAQELYEGIDMGSEGAEGLITYMRTDSVRIAPEALHEARSYILSEYGKEYLPDQPRFYSTKKSAQDAHEAIRPTNLHHPPEKVKSYLTKDQYMLYSLIWKRLIASQMESAIYDTVSADIESQNGLLLRATGSTLKFRGFLAAYEEKKEEEEEKEDEATRLLPPLEENEVVKHKEVLLEQSFTRPPPRFSEASLIKELEKSGIGRPSTYATIMGKIQSREYTVKEQGRLKPTELGRVCAQLLEDYFSLIMNIDFTAHMEDDLEEIADNKKEWKSVVRDFWNKFIPTVEEAEKSAHVPRIPTDILCPKCKVHHLQKIWSRSKYFYGCSGYPECDYSAPLEEVAFNKEDYDPNFNWDQLCPNCQSPMKVRHGRFGTFLGCTRYPECRGTVNVPKKGEASLSQEEMPACPAIGCPGKIQMRRSRFGKIFYSCTTYPDCDVIVNALDDLATKYANHPRTPYQKKSRFKKKKGEIEGKTTSKTRVKAKSTSKSSKKEKRAPSTRKQPQKQLSAQLQELLGVAQLSRGEVTKQLWDYIKSHKLQDPKNKRLIIPDQKLAALFGSSEPLDMLQLAGVISKHLQS